MATRYTSGVRQASANNYPDDISVNRIALGNVGFNPIGFTPIYTTPQFADVNLLHNSFTTMENRRYKAAESMSKVNETVAKIGDLVNPQESAWLEGLKNETTNSLQSDIDNGDYGQAIFKSIQLPSQILGRADVRGRINYNAKREEERNIYKQMIAAGKISSTALDMWDEDNPYNYIDIRKGETEESARKNRQLEQEYATNPEEYLLNHQGNIPESIANNTINNPITGGSSWKSNYSLVNSINKNELWDKAVAIVAKQGGAVTKPLYKTKDGRTTDKASEADPDNPYPWFMDEQQNVITVDEKELKKAMERVIADTPGARESINQDLRLGLFETGKQYKQINGSYFDENGNIVDNEFTDDGGLPLTYDQYVSSLVDSGARIRSKHIGTHKLTPSVGMTFDSNMRTKLAENKAKSSSGSGGVKNALYDQRLGLVPVPSVNKRLPIEGLFANQHKMDNFANSIIEAAQKAKVQFDNNTSIEEIYSKLPSVAKTNELQDAYDSYIFTKQLIDQNILTNENSRAKEVIDAMRLVAAHDNGYAVDKNNIYYNKYNSELNNLFYNKDINSKVDTLYIPLQYNNYDFSSKLKPLIQNKFGNAISYDDSGKYITISDKDRNVLPALIDLIEGYNSTSGSSKFSTGLFKGPTGTVNHTLHFDTYYKDKNGNLKPFNRTPLIGSITGNRFTNNISDIYNEASNRINKVIDGEDNSIKYYIDEKTGSINDYGTIQTYFVPFSTFGNAMVSQRGADKQEIDAHIANTITSMKNYVPKATDDLLIGLNGHDAVSIKDPEDKRIIWNLLRSDKTFDDLGNYGYDPLTYDPKFHIDRNSSMNPKTRQQINSIINKYLKESGLPDDIKSFDVTQSVDVIIPNFDDGDAIKQTAMMSPDYQGTLSLMQYKAAKMTNIPISQNVVLDIDSRSIKLNGGNYPIPLASGTIMTDKSAVIDNDASIKSILGNFKDITEHKKSYSKGDLSEDNFKSQLKQYISLITGQAPESVDVKSIVDQMIDDTKSHYNIR